MLELKLLGVPRLVWDGIERRVPSPKVFAVLSYLAVAGDARTRGELLELFWDAGKPSNLRFALHKLREVPGSEVWLETHDGFVRVEATSDVRRLEEALRQGRIDEALLLVRTGEGDAAFLRGLDLPDAPHFTSWLERERSRLEGLCLAALLRGVELLEGRGASSDALQLAHELLGRDPLAEAAHRAVMRLEHARGNDEAALAQFETCRALLREELGMEPLPETLELLGEIEGKTPAGREAARLVREEAHVPFRPGRLVGRDAAVAQVRAALGAGGRLLLRGFGGAGKTALAATIAAQHLAERSGAILWVEVGDSAPDALFSALGVALEAQRDVNRAVDGARAVRERLAASDVGLVVLDDVWNAYSLSRLLEAVPEAVPVLITSRHRYPKLTRLEVGRLAREASLELLDLHADRALERDERGDALCEALGDHAFAVRLAGIALAVDGLAAGELLERIAGAPHTLRVPTGPTDEGRESVSALLETSLAALTEEAYEAFMAFGALYVPSATSELLSLCTRRTAEATEEALFDLQRRGLAERYAEPGSDRVAYRLHDLAFSFARANNHHRPSTAERACAAFLDAYQRDVAAVDAEIANLLGAARAFETRGDDARLVRAMTQLAADDAYYRARGHSPASFSLLRAALEASRKLGDLATSHRLAARIGDAYRELYGDFGAAFAAFEEALELARACGDDHREIVMLTLLGTTRSQQGSSEADRYLEQAHRLAERRGDDRALCQVLEHRGCLAVREARFSAARAWFADGFRAVARLEAEGRIERTELARLRFFLLLNAGEAEKGAGDPRRALHYRHEALELASGLQNPLWMAYALHELGETYHGLGDRRRAQEMYARAVHLYRENRVTSTLDALTAFMAGANYALPEEAEAEAAPQRSAGAHSPWDGETRRAR